MEEYYEKIVNNIHVEFTGQCLKFIKDNIYGE